MSIAVRNDTRFSGARRLPCILQKTKSTTQTIVLLVYLGHLPG